MNRQCPGLSPSEIERLALLMEECSEVIQICGKILRHGYQSHHPAGGPTNRELLQVELGHVRFAQDFMSKNSDLSLGEIYTAAVSKAEKVKEYLHQNHRFLLKYHG